MSFESCDLAAAAEAERISSDGRLELWEDHRAEVTARIEALQQAEMPPIRSNPPMVSDMAFDDVAKPVTAQERRPAGSSDKRTFTAFLEEVPSHTPAAGLKDMIAVAGHAVTAGLDSYPSRPAPRDAPVVAALRKAGIGIQGMLDMDALAYGPTGMSSQTGPAINALDPTVLPGGSSSGSAVAVAAGLLDCSLGTDAGGSNRIPAALNGVVGVKPTYGRIPMAGVLPLAPSLDHVGPMARSVNAAAAVFSVIDPKTVSGRGLAIRGDQPIVMGIPSGYFFDELDAATRAAMDVLLQFLREHPRIRLVDVEIPHPEHAAVAQSVILTREALQVNSDLLRTHAAALPDLLRLRLELGLLVPSGAYKLARKYQERWRSTVDAAFTACHVLLTPTLPVRAPLIEQVAVGLTTTQLLTSTALARLVAPFNLSGHPALSIPFAGPKGEMPIGVQLVGPRNRDSELLAVAETVEALIGSAYDKSA